MSIFARMDEVIGAMIITCSGPITLNDIAGQKKEFSGHPPPTQKVLVDLREAQLRMTPNDLMHLAATPRYFHTSPS